MNDDVCLAMEYNWTLTFRVKNGGGETVVIGECHYVDEKRECYVVDTDAGWARVNFADVITVTS
jgi:hypothetical protein